MIYIYIYMRESCLHRFYIITRAITESTQTGGLRFPGLRAGAYLVVFECLILRICFVSLSFSLFVPALLSASVSPQ